MFVMKGGVIHPRQARLQTDPGHHPEFPGGW
jgi:hypothetical protein